MSIVTTPRSLRWLGWATTAALTSAAAHAEMELPRLGEPNLTLYRDGDSYLKNTIQIDTAFFAEKNAWFGESRANAGDHVDYWNEFGVMPGVEGVFAREKFGAFRARLSGVWTTTQIGLDAAGSNFDERYPKEMTLEDAYIGWSSGSVFPTLGKDAIDISFGSQKYQVGTGFLFWDGATDGGSRGGYWLGMRKAFELTGIVRLTTGPFRGELVYLRPNDLDETTTDIFGTNLEWTFGERASIGAGYWFVASSDDFRRDGLDVVDLRGEVHPLDILPGLVLAGEIVYEKNSDRNESWGGYAEAGYEFASVFATPYVSYRYSHFSGDRGSASQIEHFDPLFYGMSDWSSWYQGEIFGEFVAANRNHETHMLRLRVEPADEWTVTMLGMSFHLDEFATDLQPRLFDPRVANIRDKDLAEELDLIVDWKLSDHLLLTGVFGALFPSNGVEQATGGNETWLHAMLYASLSF